MDDPTADDTLEGYSRRTRGYEKAEILSGDHGRRNPPTRLAIVGVTALLVTHA